MLVLVWLMHLTKLSDVGMVGRVRRSPTEVGAYNAAVTPISIAYNCAATPKI